MQENDVQCQWIDWTQGQQWYRNKARVQILLDIYFYISKWAKLLAIALFQQ